MSWFEIVALIILLAGIGAGGFLVAQRPTFWVGLVSHVTRQVWPIALQYVIKRNTPEGEAQMRDCLRRGGEGDNFRKKCRNR